MKNLILLTLTTLFILVILIPEKTPIVKLPNELSSTDSTFRFGEEEPSDTAEIDESVWDDYDWKTIVTDKDATMTLSTPFAKNPDAELDIFKISIQKQKGESYKPTIEFKVPPSIDVKKGLDFQFLQMTEIDNTDTTIIDSDGPLHLELKTNSKGESYATLNNGAIKLPNGNTYDFIKKCNAYNQLMIEFHYKSGEQKSILIQLITFTENYRIIE
jgi:hypothetical protein